MLPAAPLWGPPTPTLFLCLPSPRGALGSILNLETKELMCKTFRESGSVCDEHHGSACDQDPRSELSQLGGTAELTALVRV